MKSAKSSVDSNHCSALSPTTQHTQDQENHINWIVLWKAGLLALQVGRYPESWRPGLLVPTCVESYESNSYSGTALNVKELSSLTLYSQMQGSTGSRAGWTRLFVQSSTLHIIRRDHVTCSITTLASRMPRAASG